MNSTSAPIPHMSTALALHVQQITSNILLNLVSLPQDFDENIHNARKSIKSLRALLRLYRPLLGDEYSRSQSCLKQLGQQLSPFRDQFILRQTWTKYVSADEQSQFKEFGEYLAKHPLPSERDINKLIQQLTQQYAGFLLLSQQVSTKLKDSLVSHAMLKERYATQVKRARKISRQSSARHTDSALRHLQRKRLKDLYYALTVLNKPLKATIKKEMLTLKLVTECLGDANDIENLLECIQSHALKRKKSLIQGLHTEQTSLWKQVDEKLIEFFEAFQVDMVNFERR